MYMFKKEESIKNRIFRNVFSLILLIFGVIILIFNLCINIYIKSIAEDQLQNISSIKDSIVTPYNEKSRIIEQFQVEVNAARINLNNVRTEGKSFIVSSNYEVVEGKDIEEAELIIERIKHKNLDLEYIKEINIRTTMGSYYITMTPLADNEELQDYYICFYVDTTSVTNFARIINTFLMIVIGLVMFVTTIITIILSERITRPIKKLSELASDMGRGDFTKAQTNLNLKEIELKELAENMNKAAKQLEIYDKDQKTFFQNASHELRTPLMSIKCYAEGLQYGIMDEEKVVTTILNEVNKMSQMVEDLLYVSKIDNITKAYEKNKYDLREILASCAGNQKAIAENNKITFEFKFDKEEVFFNCNENLISRAFTNLISNAIRYAKEYITLVCKKEKDKIIVQVIDDGKGIAKEDMYHIFERFYKGKKGNHGIGLSIVKAIVEQNNGTIIAENVENDAGASFTITFKL